MSRSSSKKQPFENVGVMELAASKRSLKGILNDLPFTTFKHEFYVSIKGLEDVIAGRKKTVTVVMRTGDRANESCEAHRD